MGKMKVVICGATGFIGRNFVEYASRIPEWEVVGVYNKRPPFECSGVTWTQADLTDSAQVDSLLSGVDLLIQAAATTSGSKDAATRPQIHVTDNAVMNSYLFRAAFEKKLKHVVFFSCTVMLQSSAVPLTEDDLDANAQLHPRYFGAGWTKFYLEKMCEFYARLGETKFTAIRHSNIYGPHDKFDLERSHVFGATITKVLTADRSVTVWGSGDEGRDLLYIDDLVDMVSKVVEKQPNKFAIYNCGAGVAVSIKDLVARIVLASGKHLEIEHDMSMPSIPTTLFLDCSKAGRELGWQPRWTLEEGIGATIKWWRQAFSSSDTVSRG